MTRQEMKERAKQALGRNLFGEKWLMALLVSLIFGAVMAASSAVCGVGELILIGPMSIGFCSVMLRICRTGESSDIGKMFKDGFTPDFGKNLLIGLMQYIFICLWSLLLVVPGIVKSYSYAMTEFIAVDHPEYNWNQCIDASKVMMDGNKWRLFVLDLSFIGWMIVSSLLCGIGYLWLTPYMSATRAEFYLDLVNRSNEQLYGSHQYTYQQ